MRPPAGGWHDRRRGPAGGFADVALERGPELALVEIWDWLGDVGDAFRTWDRKLEQWEARGDGRVCGVWVLRATQRNRALVRGHRAVFRARFSGSGAAWLAALSDPRRPMP